MKFIISFILLASLRSFAAGPQYVGAISINPCQDAKILADWYSKLGVETSEAGGGFSNC
jgi:hypothetical protein